MNSRDLLFYSTEKTPILDEKKTIQGEEEFLKFIFHKELQQKNFDATFKSELGCNGVSVANPDFKVNIKFPRADEIEEVLEKNSNKIVRYQEVIQFIEAPLMFYLMELAQTKELPETAVILLNLNSFMSKILNWKDNYFRSTLKKVFDLLRESYESYLVSVMAEFKSLSLSELQNKKIFQLINLTPTKQAFKFAASFATAEIIEQFLQRYDVNILFDKANTTPLMCAALEGNLEIIKALLQHKAKIDLIDDEGKTALMYAASNSQLETVKFLVEQKANVNIVNQQGEYASDVSCRYNTIIFDENKKERNESIRQLLSEKEDPRGIFCSNTCLVM